MRAVRRFLAQRNLAVLLCMATLLLKLLVPAGYMVGSENGRPVIELCSGVAPSAMAAEMPGMNGGMPGHGKPMDHGKAQMPCAFSGLLAVSLGAIDPIQFAALIAFIMVSGRAVAVLAASAARTYLRPPLRGPPACL